jgi:hypothetical protein
MTKGEKFVTEMTIINLTYAREEISESGAQGLLISRSLDHIDKAIANLRRLAPDYDTTCQIEYPGDRGVAWIACSRAGKWAMRPALADESRRQLAPARVTRLVNWPPRHDLPSDRIVILRIATRTVGNRLNEDRRAKRERGEPEQALPLGSRLPYWLAAAVSRRPGVSEPVNPAFFPSKRETEENLFQNNIFTWSVNVASSGSLNRRRAVRQVEDCQNAPVFAT